MARRKNVKRIDPRYFMDEKMERLDEATDPSDQPAGGADSIAQKKAKCKGKWMEHGMKGYDGSRGHYGYCEEKKIDENQESELSPGTRVRKRKSAADVVAPEGRIIGSPEQRGDELIYKVRWTKHAQGQPARVPASVLEPM
jgi:hypothetical protein